MTSSTAPATTAFLRRLSAGFAAALAAAVITVGVAAPATSSAALSGPATPVSSDSNGWQ